MIYSTITAALFWPRAGPIRFDAPAAGNRPGRHGFWQRPLERVRLSQAPLLIPQSRGALDEAPVTGRPAVVVPVAVGRSGPVGGVRDIAAITYGANPQKKGLDRVLAAWAGCRRPGEELVDRTVGQAQCDYRGLSGFSDLRLHLRGFAGRRHVDSDAIGAFWTL